MTTNKKQSTSQAQSQTTSSHLALTSGKQLTLDIDISPVPNPLSSDMGMGFNPSSYQSAIFEWLEKGRGSAVVSAVPGSGKTTTLVKGSNYIPMWLKAGFLAFNKHIARELKGRLPIHIKASTIHSLGLSSIFRHYRVPVNIEKSKYSILVRDFLQEKGIVDPMEFKLELKRLKELIKFTQLTLTNPLDSLELRRLCHTYGISTKGDWELIEEGVVQVLEQGMNAAKHSISYDDMVWLPIVLNIPIRGFNFLFIDEAQDLNQAQLALVLKAHKEGARGIFVGDPNQAIMGFAAADNKSIQNIIAQTNAITLPLSICYRCPLKHIELANKLYPVIESAPNAKEGTVKEIDISDIPRLVKSGDLIICRCFYPLILVYYNLLTRGIPVTVRKKDIGKELIGLLNQIAGEQSFTLNEFRDIANEWFEKQRHEMLTDGVSSITIANLEDRVNALKAVYKGAKCENTVQLKDAILELSQSTDNSVNLTTIHGSKGLEADVVFIIRTDLMPHPRAEQDWEKEQERNLMFVALTRAKKDLFFAN